jgi:hypothetical protein
MIVGELGSGIRMDGSLYFDCESGCKFNEALSAFTMSYGVNNLLTSVPPCDNGICVLPSITDGIDLDSGDLADMGIKVLDASKCERLKFVSLSAVQVEDNIRLILPRDLSDLRVLTLCGVTVEFNSAELWLDNLVLDWHSEVFGLGTVHFADVHIDNTTRFKQDSLVLNNDVETYDNIPSISEVGSSPKRLTIAWLDRILQQEIEIKSDNVEEISLFGSIIAVTPLSETLRVKNLRVLNLEAQEVRSYMRGYGREVCIGAFGNRLLFGSDKLKEINIRAEKIDSVDEKNLREYYSEFGVRLSVTRV